MRKLVLISAFILASVSAQAGQSHGPLQLAAVAIDRPEESRPLPPKSEAKSSVRADTARSEALRTQASRSKTQTLRYQSGEAQARRIAARYGVHW